MPWGARSEPVSDSNRRPLTLSIDAMGGDHGPPVTVAGADLALDRMAGRAVRFQLHGDERAIQAELARHPRLGPYVSVHHTDKVISGEEKAGQALRRGKGSSLWNAIQAVQGGEADAAISGGNTGALMAISKLLLRMTSDGLDRPAIISSWPTRQGVTAMLDVGANLVSDAAQLVEFAIMGEAFYAAVHAQPGQTVRVGLMNVGSEEEKGRSEVREAHALLKDGGIDLDYFGFVEGDDIARGTVEVIVTDGFTGNVALKTGEGLARFFIAELRQAMTSSPLSVLGAYLARGALRRLAARLEPPGGGPLLGLNGVVVKAHGGGAAHSFADALKIAVDLAASDYAAKAAANMQRLAAALTAPRPASGTLQ
jgi:glycerol-3-phosphate acyltransferase PlsX